MTSRSLQLNWWRSIRQLLTGRTAIPDRWECFQRVIIQETEAFTVPTGIRRLRVVHGAAWVSYLREDIIVQAGQVLHLMPDREGIVVTAIGRQPLELELYR